MHLIKEFASLDAESARLTRIKNRILGLMTAVAVIGILTMLAAACTPIPLVPVNPAEVKAQVVKACTVFEPVSASVEALYVLDPKVLAVGTALKGLCAAQDAIDPTNLKTLVNSTIPAALAALKGMAPPAVSDALLLAQVALAAALAAYGTPTVAPVPASAPAAASSTGSPS